MKRLLCVSSLACCALGLLEAGCGRKNPPPRTEVNTTQATAQPLIGSREWKRFEALPGSRVRIDGTSTIHDWFAEGQTIGGFFEVPPDFQLSPALPPGKINAQAQVAIPVRTLKSSSGNLMNKIMYEAMKNPQFSRIDYRLLALTLPKTPAGAGPVQFQSQGHLVVAGVTNLIRMPVTMESPGQGRIRIKGAVGLKMTDFKIPPPELNILGRIKTGDQIQVTFDWLLELKPQTL